MEFLSLRVLIRCTCGVTHGFVAEVWMVYGPEIRRSWLTSNTILWIIVDRALLIVGFEDRTNWLLITDFSLSIILGFMIRTSHIFSQLRLEFFRFTLWTTCSVCGSNRKLLCPLLSLWCIKSSILIFIINFDFVSLWSTSVPCCFLILSSVDNCLLHFLDSAHLSLMLEISKLLLIVDQLVLALVLLVEVSCDDVVHIGSSFWIGCGITFPIFPLFRSVQSSSFLLISDCFMLLCLQLPSFRHVVGVAVSIIIWRIVSIGMSCIYPTQHFFWLQLLIFIIWLIPRWRWKLVSLRSWLLTDLCTILIICQIHTILLGVWHNLILLAQLLLVVVCSSIQWSRIHFVQSLPLCGYTSFLFWNSYWHICNPVQIGSIHFDVISIVTAENALFKLLRIIWAVEIWLLRIEISQLSKLLELAIWLINSFLIVEMVYLLQNDLAYLWSFTWPVDRALTHFILDLCFGLSLLSFYNWFICIILDVCVSLLSIVELVCVYITLVCFNIELPTILTIFLRLGQSKRITSFVFTIISYENARIGLLSFREHIVVSNWYLVLIKNCLGFVHLSFGIDVWQNSCSAFFTMILFRILFECILMFDSFILSFCLIRSLHLGSLLVKLVHHHS